MKNLLFFLLLSLVVLKSQAQKSNNLREEFVNLVLSDTMIGMGYLLPLKIKAKHSDTLIYFNQTQFLFQYFHEQYGWDGKTFMNNLRPYVLYNKVFPISDQDTSYFFKYGYMKCPITNSKCKVLHKETKEELEKKINDVKSTQVLDRFFACLVYKCFQKNIIVAILEGEVLLGIFPPIRINEVDGTPLD